MEVTGNASYIQIFYDEHGNTYYYADPALYRWRSGEYRKTAGISSDGIIPGLSQPGYTWPVRSRPSVFLHT